MGRETEERKRRRRGKKEEKRETGDMEPYKHNISSCLSCQLKYILLSSLKEIITSFFNQGYCNLLHPSLSLFICSICNLLHRSTDFNQICCRPLFSLNFLTFWSKNLNKSILLPVEVCTNKQCRADQMLLLNCLSPSVCSNTVESR